ncbi:hypothetical protein K353_02666 [Kitasatospora sp. SolWspMP-SS2h]|uniref:DUF3592 domain-containing protein n=1 Tax=Kitasatospora sp. SolWspMP-SS2h TaxID=1305729 RepID=UPI000DBA316F|nr:DUF3592 domain-containing protein [Kitasatospora sp. SolWspMP-SS2h]RAJ42314.1 hypothetical protein K353_02666 [Kitasatospora sp. SolWspMP-SS2h]
METPTTLVGGAVLTVFGSALLLWCAVELRLRHRLRRYGVPATAQVVADPDPAAAMDGSPLLSYPVVSPGGRTGLAADLPAGLPADLAVAADAGAGTVHELRPLAVPDGTSRLVLARPRGNTPLRRPARLVPGAAVQVAYDPRRPDRVVLAAHEELPSLPADLFWALLATSALAGGLTLLALALR